MPDVDGGTLECPADAPLGAPITNPLSECNYECDMSQILGDNNVDGTATSSICGSGSVSECAYVCDAGYAAVGSALCVPQGEVDAGEWSFAREEACVAACTSSTFATNSSVNVTATAEIGNCTTSLGVCNYTCDDGYAPNPDGDRMAYCNETAQGPQWVTDCVPVCDVDLLANIIEYVNVSRTKEEFGVSGNVQFTSYSCEDGFHDTTQAVCVANVDGGTTWTAHSNLPCTRTMWRMRVDLADCAMLNQDFIFAGTTQSPDKSYPFYRGFRNDSVYVYYDPLCGDVSNPTSVANKYVVALVDSSTFDAENRTSNFAGNDDCANAFEFAPSELWMTNANDIGVTCDPAVPRAFVDVSVNALESFCAPVRGSDIEIEVDGSVVAADPNPCDCGADCESDYFILESGEQCDFECGPGYHDLSFTLSCAYGTINITPDVTSALSSCVPIVCNFTDRLELLNAVNAYVNGGGIENETLACNGFMKHWNVSLVRDMSGLFMDLPSFNEDISEWDVSSVTDMTKMFSGAESFNADIGAWDVSSNQELYRTFHRASLFNRDLHEWNTSELKSLRQTFYGASSFNGNISNWNIAGVANIRGLFKDALAFNGDLTSFNVDRVNSLYETFKGTDAFDGHSIAQWNVEKVTTLHNTFNGANSFNGDISNWNVEKVESLQQTFRDASMFNADLSDWNVSRVENMLKMFFNAEKFNADLSSWDVSNVQYIAEAFGVGTASFDGRGVYVWNPMSFGDVSSSDTIFGSSNNISDCTKRRIYDSWYSQEDAITADVLSDSGNWNILEPSCALSCDGADALDVSDLANVRDCLPEDDSDVGTRCRLVCEPYYGLVAAASSSTAAACVGLQNGYTDAYCQSTCLSGVSWHPQCFRNGFPGRVDDFYVCNCSISEWAVCDATWGDWIEPPMSCEPIVCEFENAAHLVLEVAEYVVSGTSSCGGHISRWDVSNVNDMAHLFQNLVNFDANISAWNTANVTDMSYMFNNAAAFDADISGWNVSKVSNLNRAFGGTSSLDQNLGAWDVSNVVMMETVFSRPTGLSNCNKRQIFDSWTAKSSQNVTNSTHSWALLAPECASFHCGAPPSFEDDLSFNATGCIFDDADGLSCAVQCDDGYSRVANLRCDHSDMSDPRWVPEINASADPDRVRLCVRSATGIFNFGCENGYGNAYNQIYYLAGTTIYDHRPYYRGSVNSSAYIFYDRACSNEPEPRWILSMPHDFDPTRSQNIGGDPFGSDCNSDLSWISEARTVPIGNVTIESMWCGTYDGGPRDIYFLDIENEDDWMWCPPTAVSFSSNYNCTGHDPSDCRLPNGQLDPYCGNVNGSCANYLSQKITDVASYSVVECEANPDQKCPYMCCDMSTSNFMTSSQVLDIRDVECEPPHVGGGQYICAPYGEFLPLPSATSCVDEATLPNSAAHGPANGGLCNHVNCDEFECCCSNCATLNCSDFSIGSESIEACGKCDDVDTLYGAQWTYLANAQSIELPACYLGAAGMPDLGLPGCVHDCYSFGVYPFTCDTTCDEINENPCTWDCDSSDIALVANTSYNRCADAGLAPSTSLIDCVDNPIGVVLPDDALHGPANGGACDETNCELKECCCSECKTRNCSSYESGETAVRLCGKCTDVSDVNSNYNVSSDDRAKCFLTNQSPLKYWPQCLLDCVRFGVTPIDMWGDCSTTCDRFYADACSRDCSQEERDAAFTLGEYVCNILGTPISPEMFNCTLDPSESDTSCLPYALPEDTRPDSTSVDACAEGIRLDASEDRRCDLVCKSGLVPSGISELICFEGGTSAVTSLKCCNTTFCYENCIDYADCWMRADNLPQTGNCSNVPAECEVCNVNCVNECDTSSCPTPATDCEIPSCIPGVSSGGQSTLVCGLVAATSGHCTTANGLAGTCRTSGLCEPSTVLSHFEVEYEVVDGDDYNLGDPNVLNSFREVVARIVPCDEKDITSIAISRRELSAIVDRSRGRRRTSEVSYDTFVLTFDVIFYDFQDAEDGAANVQSAVVTDVDSEESELMDLLISSLTRNAMPDWTQQFYFRNDDCMWPANAFAVISEAQISDLRFVLANSSLPETCYRAEILSGHVINVFDCNDPVDCSAKLDEVACVGDIACVWADQESTCSLLVNCTETTDANLCNASSTCVWDQTYGCTFSEFVPLASVRLSRATGDVEIAFVPLDLAGVDDGEDGGVQTIVVVILGGVGGLLLVVATGVFWYVRRQQALMQQRRDQLKHKLQATRRMNRRKARDIRMLQSAWEMGYDELEFVQCLASKSTDSVWYATYKGFAVAVKISKGSSRSEDDEVFDDSKSSSTSSSSLLTSSTTMTSSSSTSKSERRPLSHEIQFLMRTRHERLNSFLGCGRSPEGDTFIVLEYAVGGSMDRWLWNRPMGGLPWLQRAIFLRDAASGLSFLHGSHQSIHRDIKSQNILICRESKMWRAKVADFGLSRIVLAGKKRVRKRKARHHKSMYGTTKNSKTAHWDKEMESFVGTPNWMATELIVDASPSSNRSTSKYGPAVDVYSFACVIFETLAYAKPWDGLSKKEIFGNVRRGLRPDVATAQQIDKDEEAAQIIPLMRACWASKAADRPDMTHVLTFLKNMVHQLEAKRDEGMIQREATQTDRVAAAVRPSVESADRLAYRVFSSFNDDHPDNAFTRADANKDGFLSFDEFSSWLSELSLQRGVGMEEDEGEDTESMGQARSMHMASTARATTSETRNAWHDSSSGSVKSKSDTVVIEMTAVPKA
eukprot:g383.t1